MQDLSVTDIDEALLRDVLQKAPMYGRDCWYDGPCIRSYDPYEHAESIHVPIITRPDIPDSFDAFYSEKHQAIFVRPGLHPINERCAIAHEIVHWENSDQGESQWAEDRADSKAARRLIRRSEVFRYNEYLADMGEVALALEVTFEYMDLWLRQWR